jgi:alkylation response protein AidB-like acyl-CoA dehydrogenase
VARANQDPYILERFGNMWAALHGLESLADSAGEKFQTAWEKDHRLSPDERGKLAVIVATAKVLASRATLDVTAQIFETMGASATAALWQFDRFWRNARTLTLHDRLDYKVQELGQWALNDQFPTPSFYS